MRVVVTLILLLLSSEAAPAQSTTTGVYRFLEITPDARTAALGGNHVGLYGGGLPVFHLNPAYISAGDHKNVSATYVNLLADASMGFSSGAWDLGDPGTIGLGIRYLGYGDFNRLDEQGNSEGSFSAGDIAVSGGYSRELMSGSGLRAGASATVIYSSYGEYKSSALSAAGGLYYYKPEMNFSAGLSFRNLGAQLSTYDGRREPLPFDISAGVSGKPENFPFQLNLTLRQLNNPELRVFGEEEAPGVMDNLMRHVIFGGEAELGGSLMLRLGYDHYLHEQTKTGKAVDLAGASFGVGFKVKSFIIDLSRNSYSKLGGITRISLRTSFN